MNVRSQLLTTLTCAVLVSAAAAPSVASAQTSSGVPTPAATTDGHHTPPPSLEDMLARERTHTYAVDMANLQARSSDLQAAASWRDECLDTDIGDWQVGWVKNRNQFCTHADLFLSVPDNGTGKPGVVFFEWLFYGEGSTGSGSQRTLTLHTELLNLHSDPDFPFPENKPITSSVGCTVQIPASNPQGACLGSMSVTKSLSQWQADPTATNYVYSNEKTNDGTPTGEGLENVVMIGFTPAITTVIDSLATSVQAPATWAAADNAVSFNAYARFDSAPYLTTKQGAIFRGVVPHLSYDPDKPRAEEVAEHIRDACDPDTVNDTYPSAGGDKHIPGCSIDDLIHRLAPSKGGTHEARYNKNGNAKDRNCNANTPQTPSTGTKQCDEFPFASTYEGAAASDYPASEFAGGGKSNQFSIRKVNAQQNGNAGRDLNTWYGQDRILDWATGGTSSTSADGKMRDGFWVRIGQT